MSTPFDPEAYIAQGRANADALKQHGFDAVVEALGPERDWADELLDAWHDGSVKLAELIRTRCRPIGNDIVTDEWLKGGVARILNVRDCAPKDRHRAVGSASMNELRAIIKEANGQ